jgi:hypothetical protein
MVLVSPNRTVMGATSADTPAGLKQSRLGDAAQELNLIAAHFQDLNRDQRRLGHAIGRKRGNLINGMQDVRTFKMLGGVGGVTI